MQGAEDHHRIDLAELKLHIVKKIGAERSRRYFYYLGRFLSQKLTKVEFDKSCHRLLGRENLPLHNKLIHSILKNASLAKSPPLQKTKSLVLGKEDGPQQSGSLIPNHNPVLSNGVLHKVRSGTCDRPSPLGPNGKVDSLLHQPLCREDRSGNRNKENGDVGPVIRDDYVAQEERGRLVLSKNPVMAPLGIIPFSVTRRIVPASTKGDFITCYDSGGLSETEMLRKRMESIAAAEGLGGVSAECSTMLNSMLDVYLKKLVKSCVDLSGARSTNGNQRLDKPQSREKIVNGMWPSNQASEITQEQQHPVSLLDFRAAMELNPHQLGEDWPLLLEKISMRSFEEREGV
ncbi:BnaA01g05800D [Brassica napus]|uniref:BnaA01g05800D protein n=2 Tax=Brassica napus TaxID=3708 RepID=A0A078GSS8_BRANA|nr:BnaA01g05800D [Brassica napus]